MKQDRDIKHDLKRIANAGNTAPLSQQEKKELRREFIAFLDMHPAARQQATAVRRAGLAAWTRQYAVGFALLIIVSGGTLYMHTGSSLPLTNNQPIETITSVQSLRADTTLLAQKLREAEQLVMADRFEAHTFATVSNDIHAYTTGLHADIAQAQSAGNTEGVLDASAELEMLLDAHRTILHVLADAYERHDDEHITELLHELDYRRAQIAEMRTSLETGREDDRADFWAMYGYAEGLFADIQQANMQIDEMIWSFKTERTKYEDALLQQAERLIDRSAETLREARDSLNDEEYERAVRLLREAAQDTQKALIFADAYAILYGEHRAEIDTRTVE